MKAKSLFRACMKESFGGATIALYLIVLILTLALDENTAYAVLFSVVLFLAFTTARMFSVREINCINTGFAAFLKRRPRYILTATFLSGVPLLLMMELKAFLCSPGIAPGILAVWLCAVVWGALIGAFFHKGVLGYALILGCFFLFLQKLLIHELYLRYISPKLIWEGEYNPFNLAGIAFLAATGIVLLFWDRKKQLLLTAAAAAIFFTGLTVCETQYEKSVSEQFCQTTGAEDCPIQYSADLDKARVEHISDIICEAETCLAQYGFDFQTTGYRMERTVYFPWENSRQKVLFSFNDGQCAINFYTESMYHISDEELITRYIYSRLKQANQLQEVAAELLADDVASRVLYQEESALLRFYSYESLMEDYGYCASPKQCAAAECIRTDRESFAFLYDALGNVQAIGEINIDELDVSDTYREIFRRITE